MTTASVSPRRRASWVTDRSCPGLHALGSCTAAERVFSLLNMRSVDPADEVAEVHGPVLPPSDGSTGPGSGTPRSAGSPGRLRRVGAGHRRRRRGEPGPGDPPLRVQGGAARGLRRARPRRDPRGQDADHRPGAPAATCWSSSRGGRVRARWPATWCTRCWPAATLAADFLDRLTADAEAYLAEGVAAGGVRPSRDPAARARFLVQAGVGAMLVSPRAGTRRWTATSGHAAGLHGRAVRCPRWSSTPRACSPTARLLDAYLLRPTRAGGRGPTRSPLHDDEDS